MGGWVSLRRKAQLEAAIEKAKMVEPDHPPLIIGNRRIEPSTVVSHRVVWSWWDPLGWVVEVTYDDGSIGHTWSALR